MEAPVCLLACVLVLDWLQPKGYQGDGVPFAVDDEMICSIGTMTQTFRCGEALSVVHQAAQLTRCQMH